MQRTQESKTQRTQEFKTQRTQEFNEDPKNTRIQCPKNTKNPRPKEHNIAIKNKEFNFSPHTPYITVCKLNMMPTPNGV